MSQRRILPLAAVILGALGLFVLVANRTDSEAAQRAQAVTIKTKPKRGLILGERGWVSVETHTESGTPYTLDIYESPYPYKHETLLYTVDYTASGGVEDEVQPKFNTRYRAEIRGRPETSTRSRPLWVYPKRSDIKTRYHRHGRVTSKMILDVSPQLPYDLDGRRLFFYFREVGTNRWYPKERTRTRVVSPGHIRGNARFHIPTDHKYRFYTTWCFEPKKRDFGVGRPVDQTCPHHPFRRHGFFKAPTGGQRPSAAALTAQRD
jgi:hypothetical protein